MMVSKAENINVGLVEESKAYTLVAIASSTQSSKSIIQLLRHLPPNTGMCFIYFQQLENKSESHLLTLLTGSTKMKVFVKQTGTKLQPDCLIVVPANKVPGTRKGIVTLSPLLGKFETAGIASNLFTSINKKVKVYTKTKRAVS